MTSKEAGKIALDANIIIQSIVIAAVLGISAYIWNSTTDNAKEIEELRSQIKIMETRNEALAEVPERLRSIELTVNTIESKIGQSEK